jgi:tetratricopeptide (TPR) repeat protein
MRTGVFATVMTLALASTLSAQSTKNVSADVQQANKHYAQGWSAMKAQSWDDAAREFQDAIETSPTFALAYYSLGRAEMGRKNFTKAIDAYTKCRDLYTAPAGKQFANQMTTRQRINDQIFEYQNAINQANAQNAGKNSNAQSQSLYVRDLQARIQRLESIRDRNLDAELEDFQVPYFVPMALGAAYFRSGQFEDAEREYKTAIAANQASGETHNNLAVLYLTTGRYDEAENEVRAAEKVGFRVNEELKGDIRRKRSGG